MKLPAPLARALKLALRALALLSFLAPLLTRVVIGMTFVQTGSGKLKNFENTVAFFSDLKIPFPELNAAFIGRLEYWGGIALVLGLFTRLFASGLFSTMVVALMTADHANFVQALKGSADVGLTDITPVVFSMFLLWLVLYGPGALSLDRLLVKWWKLDADEGPPAPQ
jgi:putative oxidoreductase